MFMKCADLPPDPPIDFVPVPDGRRVYEPRREEVEKAVATTGLVLVLAIIVIVAVDIACPPLATRHLAGCP